MTDVNEKNLSRLDARCKKCNHFWIPYQNVDIALPMEVEIPCPKCGVMNHLIYFDEELQKEDMRNKYILQPQEKLKTALLDIETLKKEIKEANEKIKSLELNKEESFENNKKLVKIIDRLADILGKLGIKLDEGMNPIAG